MPELPEVEHLRRSLERPLFGRCVSRVRVHRLDVVRPEPGLGRQFSPAGRVTARLAAGLLRGDVIDRLDRHGKQLAIIGRSGRVACVHLGMSGQVRWLAPGQRIEPASHVHVVWSLADCDDDDHARGTSSAGRLVFRDPRRFGGIWLADSMEHLRAERWDHIGPDGLTLSRTQLATALGRSASPIKAALLNQALIAGIGNIYADESLHRAGIHPARPANVLDGPAISRLHKALRGILREAVEQGGSSLRDYVDSAGDPGQYASWHRVYGRSGHACFACGQSLEQATIAQRTTVFCPYCQEADA